jgi:cystathionine beta-lyase/cystathionine gamma-synthase
MAAADIALRAMTRPGDHVILGGDAYGGTFRLLDKVLALWGVEHTSVNLSDVDAVRRAVRPATKVIWCESPTNPLLGIADIAALASVAALAGAKLVVDNTFATPYLQSPLGLGADVVLHSTTKYIEGHNATVGGALITRDAALAERLGWTRNAIGAIQSAWHAWLTLQGVKTLPLRMQRHCDNALAVARFLASHPRVTWLSYPGLASFPQAELARRQQRGGGALIAFEVAGGVEAGARLMSALRLCSLAENLGAAETLVTHPASMTHAAVPAEQRHALGISDGLVRLSVGLEEPSDLIADLAQALDA